MSTPSHPCLCAGASPAWAPRSEDRYCALCGRRLIAVAPRQPLLDPGPPPLLAVYLWPDGDGAPPTRLAGMLTFRIVGSGDLEPAVAWAADDGPALRAHPDFSPPNTLRVGLEAGPDAPAPGPFGGGRLTVSVRGVAFAFGVRAFALGRGAGRPWLRLKRGGPPGGGDLAIFRGAPPGRTFLHFQFGDGVPVQWDRVECDHPAVTVAAPRAVPAAVAVAAVDWDPFALPDGEGRHEVPFRIRVAGVEDRWFPFSQGIRWRSEAPLRFRPAGLLLPLLCEGRPVPQLVEIANADRQPLDLRRIESDAPWVEVDRNVPTLPRRLVPGDGAALRLHLHPERIPHGPGPHLARLTFVLAGIGIQTYPVGVEDVRRVRPLAVPLLIDPGPPRVVAARLGPDGRPWYFACSGGSIGAGPDRFGVSLESYARAAYAGERAGKVAARLTSAALELVRREEQFDARAAVLCGRTWLPPDLPSRADWVRLALDRAAMSDPPPSLLVRLDAWAAYAVPLDADGRSGKVRRMGSLADTVGAAALRAWMAGHGRPAVEADRLALLLQEELSTPAGAVTPSRLGLLLVVERLLSDYRWGPDYAWRRALAGTWEHAPELGGGSFDAALADRTLRQGVGRHAAALLQQLGRGGTGVSPVLWVGDLFAGPALATEVQSASQSLGTAAECAPAEWLEWLGRHAFSDLDPLPSALLADSPDREG